ITQAINRSVVEIHDRFAGGSSAAATTAATAPCKEHIQGGLWAGGGWAPVAALTAHGGGRSGTNVQLLHGAVGADGATQGHAEAVVGPATVVKAVEHDTVTCTAE